MEKVKPDQPPCRGPGAGNLGIWNGWNSVYRETAGPICPIKPAPATRPWIWKSETFGVLRSTIEELKEEAEAICGKPEKPELDDEIIAVIKWVDGTVIDSVKKVKS